MPNNVDKTSTSWVAARTVPVDVWGISKASWIVDKVPLWGRGSILSSFARRGYTSTSFIGPTVVLFLKSGK